MAQNDCKYVTIRVRDSKVRAGDKGRILMYDEDGDFYYMTTVASAFEMYDRIAESIRAKYAREMDAARAKYEEDVRRLTEENARFREAVTAQYNALLATVKDVNEKVLSMVDKSEEGQDI